ncbi:MAG TPA: GlsB/YeaQ/YmgE family stress response membrane protein [Novosphingobium sp.]|nr:GlsB/YeaQ/YmgE family stress response membrane protein [Novosphingobium sp.]
MTLILILLIGGVIGWLASILMRTDMQQGIFLNIVVGIIGSLIAGVVLTPLLGGAPITSGNFDLMSLFVSFLGAVILLAIVNLFRRGSMR